MAFVATYGFREARALVLSTVGALSETETLPFDSAAGRILAQPVTADRDYPPLARSVRDGFAVRAADLPGSLRVIGEVRAGQHSSLTVGPGEALEIMTGAPVPAGADAVIMVEHTRRDGDLVSCERAAKPGDFINPQAAECRAGDLLLQPGTPLGYAQIALLATTGHTQVTVYRKPRVAILATGDELVAVSQTPQPHEIRNSNAYSLAVQVARAGGIPEILGVAPDEYAATRRLVEQGLASDLLLLSGGVSAGKYDIVEKVLTDCGAEFFFDRVLIQPGQPVVFGKARGTFLFGLPGNPVSTMVTFEIFARAAIELLSGSRHPMLPLMTARLTAPFRHKTGLTRFLPACLSPDGSQLTPVAWQGSGDVAAVARSNAFLVADAQRESWQAGDEMPVLRAI